MRLRARRTRAPKRRQNSAPAFNPGEQASQTANLTVAAKTRGSNDQIRVYNIIKNLSPFSGAFLGRVRFVSGPMGDVVVGCGQRFRIEFEGFDGLFASNLPKSTILTVLTADFR